MKKASDMNINIVAVKIGNESEQSYLSSKNLYNSYGNNNYKIN